VAVDYREGWLFPDGALSADEDGWDVLVVCRFEIIDIIAALSQIPFLFG
jgi:hypothetical protein